MPEIPSSFGPVMGSSGMSGTDPMQSAVNRALNNPNISEEDKENLRNMYQTYLEAQSKIKSFIQKLSS